MVTLYVNEILSGDKEVVRGVMVLEKTVQQGLWTMFGEKLKNKINFLIESEPFKSEGFHTFTKFSQFVVYFQYNPQKVLIDNELIPLGSAIELLYFGTSDNINDAFDYQIKLKNAGWEFETRDEILKLAREIKEELKNPDYEIAELKIKDRPGLLSSYL
jgi:hypothetical protein